MQCDISKTFLSVRLPVSVKRMEGYGTKQKKLEPIFLHFMNHSPQFSDKKNGWWERLLLPEILGQLTGPVRAKTPIFNRYWLVALQP